MALLDDISVLACQFSSTETAEPGGWHLPNLSSESLPIRAEFDLSAPGYHARADESAENRLQALRAWREYNRTTGEAVFTDTTTIVAATHFMAVAGKDGHVTATALMDLDSFVRSVILYDHVLYLDNSSLEDENINSNLGGRVLIPVATSVPADSANRPEQDISSTLQDLFDECMHTLRNLSQWPAQSGPRIDAEQLRAGWEILLGGPVDWSLIDGRAANGQRWSSVGAYNIARMAVAQRGTTKGLEPVQLANFVEECNIRALFNMRVANSLRLPYVANSSRLPMTARRFSNAATAHDAFLDVQEIQRSVTDRASAAMRTWTTQLPVFLTAVLARCKRPEDLFEQIACWREHAAPYRSKRVELLAAIQDGNVKALKRIENAVRADIHAWRKVASPDTALAVTGSLLATGSGFAPAILTTLKVLKAVSAIDSGARMSIVNRIARRDQWFLTRLGDTAASLTNALPRVQRLWGIDDDALDDCAATLERMRALDPTWPVTATTPAPST
ncbi:MAG: hypothetical protein M3332_10870 [Actinomycetota bacterium]|nr:hypothetical protein [Actinomycetota bacterium]